MNLLTLTRYSRMGASSRLRTMQYFPFFESAGITIRNVPFFDDAYLHSFYAERKKSISSSRYFLSRLLQYSNLRAADVIWVEKEFFPWLPWFFEKKFLPKDVPYVCDIDDAVFHRYDQSNNLVVRKVLGSKIDRVMENSALVIAGNYYLGERATEAKARNVQIVPTVVDTEKYVVKNDVHRSPRTTVGWIGTPQTWRDLAEPIFDVLHPSLKAHGAAFRSIGASVERQESTELEFVPWSEEQEIQLIGSLDIGVMPLPDTPWTRGKCGYKLIQYMACGLPVIASPVGVNREIVDHGVNGFLAHNESEWKSAVEFLLSNPEARKRMGLAGRQKVEEKYSLAPWARRVNQMLYQIA